MRNNMCWSIQSIRSNSSLSMIRRFCSASNDAITPRGNLSGVMASLDAEQNLLIIDKELFDRMDWIDQHMLLRTHAPTTYY